MEHHSILDLGRVDTVHKQPELCVGESLVRAESIECEQQAEQRGVRFIHHRGQTACVHSLGEGIDQLLRAG